MKVLLKFCNRAAARMPGAHRCGIVLDEVEIDLVRPRMASGCAGVIINTMR